MHLLNLTHFYKFSFNFNNKKLYIKEMQTRKDLDFII